MGPASPPTWPRTSAIEFGRIYISRDGPLVATNAPSAARRPAADRLRLAQVVDPVRIDMHLHLYPSKEAGAREKAEYEIWE